MWKIFGKNPVELVEVVILKLLLQSSRKSKLYNIIIHYCFHIVFVVSQPQTISLLLAREHSVPKGHQEWMVCRVKMEYRVMMGRLECQEETVSIELFFLLFLIKTELKELG